MSRLQEKYQREHAENLAYDKYQLYLVNAHDIIDIYHMHLQDIEKQQEIDECEGTLIAYMGLDEFKNLSKDNLSMIVGAMQEYAENKVNE